MANIQCARASCRTSTLSSSFYRCPPAFGSRVACPSSRALRSDPAHLRSCVRAEAQNQRTVDPLQSYDDFVCDSPVCTPAVQENLKALTADMKRLRYGPNLFARDVKYQDGLRSFQGNSRFQRTRWAAENVEQPKVVIKQVRIVESATARVDWQLTGTIYGLPIDIDIVTETQHSLVTGKILAHRDKLDLSRCSAPARALVTASRLAWATKQAGLDAGESLDKASNKVQDAVASMEEDDPGVYRDPTDPTKFFQQSNNKNSDLFQAGTAIAVIYFIFRTFTELEKLN